MVKALLPTGKIMRLNSFKIGSWSHLPKGCSTINGDAYYAAHWNTRSSGGNDGGFSPICKPNYTWAEFTLAECDAAVKKTLGGSTFNTGVSVNTFPYSTSKWLGS